MITAAILLSPAAVCSQTSEWIVYNTGNSGLPFNLISALAVDAKGTVWIGTGDPFGYGRGLAQFDGENWTVYNTENSGLPHNAIYALAIDSLGSVWIGTAGGITGTGRGLAQFDGENWTVYNTENSGLPSKDVWALAFDAQGNLWIGTCRGGLAKFDGENWTVYNTVNSGLPYNDVFALDFDAQGNLWIGTYGGGLAMFDRENWTVYNKANSGLPSNDVYALAFDAQEHLWIGTAVHMSGAVGGGLAQFDGENWTVYNKGNSDLPHNDVYTLAIDAQGNVWTGSGEHVPASVGGLAKFDGVNWTVCNKENSGMPYNLVYALAIDPRGNVWMGSVNFDEPGGLVVYSGAHTRLKVVSATTTLGATVVGQPTPLEVTVVLDPPLETIELYRRMILDLSPLGIPSDLALEHAGGGRYTISTIVTPLRSGHCDLLILVETTEGERYSFLTARLDVYPGGDEYIYQDQIGSRWEVKVAAAEVDLKASDIVHQGSYSQAINSQGGYVKYTFKDPDGFSTFGYTGLEFWINPGTSSTEKAKFVPMTTEGPKYLKLRDDLGITLEANEWQVVSIPLEDLELADTRLKEIQLRGVVGTFYMDDLAFVVAEYGLEKALATPEKIKADGTMQTLLTVQTVPAVTQPGPLPTVTVDLSPIGGVHDAVMVDDGTGGDKVAGDGIYTMQTSVEAQTQNGIKDLVITSTDSRLRVARAHLPLGVLPTEDVYLYQDQVEAGWTLKLYNAEANPNSTDYVHSGSCAHAITLQTYGNVEYTLEDPDGLPTFGYATLEFWVNPGTASIEELTIVAFWHVGAALKTKVLPLVEQWGISFDTETWQQVSVPADSLELTDANLEKIRFTGDVQGTFYIDDMRFVAAEVEITAVEEVSEATAVPLGYALSQNYPNPFNPQTMIRYDLPQAGVVRLSVYNVLGQMVRTLVDGQRSAGTYSVIWDGRDGSGREVASGVYFCRLRTKSITLARKMLLLR
jgi:ligand-binding sensor domain-containing protein